MNKTSSPLIFQESPLPDALLPASIPWLWISLGVALALIATIIIILLLVRRKPADPAAARRAAFEQALREIEEASSLAPRIAAVQISLAIRRYLCTAADDTSLFETHEEFLARHPSLSHWPSDTIDSLISSLKDLAEIKYRPIRDELNPLDLVNKSRTLLITLDGQSAA